MRPPVTPSFTVYDYECSYFPGNYNPNNKQYTLCL